jgi:phenylalanyl-tRNA synthetase alpha chain
VYDLVQQDLEVDGKTYPRDEWTNTPGSILSKIPRRLHHQPDHPLGILRSLIESHFEEYTPVSPSSAVVTVAENFDELGFAADHPGRSLTDSYYLNKEHMLRTHTSAHEVATFRAGHNSWLLSADVYRRDEIDSSHYPVFHQMEGARVWEQKDLPGLKEINARMQKDLEACPLIIEDVEMISGSNPYQAEHDPELAAEVAQNLKHSLNSLIFKLFGQAGGTASTKEPLRVRWIEAFFPFTSPSYEVEVWWGGEWLEILGSGVVMQRTLQNAGE